MASQLFNEFLRASAAGEIDLNSAGVTIKVALLMSNTTCDTENAAKALLTDFTTLDRCDSAGYSDATLATKAVNKDDANNRAEFDADDVTWSALAACTRQLAGALVYKFGSADADSVPIAWVEFSPAKTPDGSDFVVSWNAEGILQFART